MATYVQREAPGIGRRTLVVGLTAMVVGGVAGGMLAWMLQSPRLEVVSRAPALSSGQVADGLRYQGLAEQFAIARGQIAWTQRYQGLADEMLAERATIARGRIAWGERYQGLADQLSGHELTRGQVAHGQR